MFFAGLRRRHTADYFRFVVKRLLAVERSLFAGESLNDDFGVGRQLEVLASGLIRIETNA